MNNEFARRRFTAAVATALILLLGAETAALGQQAPGYPTQAYPTQAYPTRAPTQGYPAPATPAYPGATDPGYPSQPAQTPPGYPQAGANPQPGTYPAQAPPAYPAQGAQGYPNPPPQGYPQQPAPPRPPSAIRNFFVSTLAAVASFTGPGVARVIGEALVGGIANWFNHGRQQQPQSAYGGGAYASSGYGTSSYGTSTYGSTGYESGSSYGTPSYGTTTGSYGTTTGSYGSTAGTYGATQGAYPQGTYAATPQGYGATPGTYPQSSYPQAAYPQAGATAGTYPQGTYPTTSPGYGAAGTATYPQTAYPQGSPGTPGYGAAGTTTYPQVASAGNYGANGTSAYRDTPMSGADGVGGSSGIYAGVAYEVHVVDPAGRATPVDPNTYAFHTGDRFVVLYRPSLPGLMEVYNVNAEGKQTRIDTARMAAGQLATLGPYQFSGAAADESLQILLTPCSTPELVTATRDIVNVSAAGPAAGQPAPGLRLANCGTTTRGLLQTRDIQKVGVDGTTSFALDPVSAPELANGQAVTRRVTINFRHR